MTAASSSTMAPHKRLIRRQPLMQRIKSYLDPWDFLLWASEELESSEWEQWQNDWAVPIGLAINLIMLVARANSRGGADDIDDVFGDDSTRMGFGSWLVSYWASLRSEHFTDTVYRRPLPSTCLPLSPSSIHSTPSSAHATIASSRSPSTMYPARPLHDAFASTPHLSPHRLFASSLLSFLPRTPPPRGRIPTLKPTSGSLPCGTRSPYVSEHSACSRRGMY